MNPPDGYTAEEWETVSSGPVVAAALISAVDYSELSERKEIAAFADHFNRVGAKFLDAGLVQAVLESTAAGSTATFKSVCDSVAGGATGETPVDERFRQIERAVAIIQSRVDAQEVAAYKRFVYDVAVIVARAHREGLLPFSNPISRIESFYLRRLRKALSI